MNDDMLIGPVISDDHMTGHNFLDFLQNKLPEQLQVGWMDMDFQYDRAPSHYT
jgi:hypothetical protein